MEEALKNEATIDFVGDVLDSEKKQDDLDCKEEGNEVDPLFQHLDRGDHNENEFTQSNDWCKKIDIKDADQLSKEVQCLDKHQRKTLDIGLEFARDLVKARNHGNEQPEPPQFKTVDSKNTSKACG